MSFGIFTNKIKGTCDEKFFHDCKKGALCEIINEVNHKSFEIKFIGTDSKFFRNKLTVPKNNLKLFDNQTANLLSGIDINKRLNFLKNTKNIEFLLSLKEKDRLKLKIKNKNEECSIAHIGSIPKYPPATYFGLDLDEKLLKGFEFEKKNVGFILTPLELLTLNPQKIKQKSFNEKDNIAVEITDSKAEQVNEVSTNITKLEAVKNTNPNKNKSTEAIKTHNQKSRYENNNKSSSNQLEDVRNTNQNKNKSNAMSSNNKQSRKENNFKTKSEEPIRNFKQNKTFNNKEKKQLNSNGMNLQKNTKGNQVKTPSYEFDSADDTKWICKMCTTQNTSEHNLCNMCKTEKGSSPSSQPQETNAFLKSIEKPTQITECQMCFQECNNTKKYLKLINCNHTICHDCLQANIKLNDKFCPMALENKQFCNKHLEDSELKLLKPDSKNEKKEPKLIICGSEQCKYEFLNQSEIEAICPTCKMTTCVICRRIHTGMTCSEFDKRNQIYKLLEDYVNNDQTNEVNENKELMTFETYPNNDVFTCFCFGLIMPSEGFTLGLCDHSYCKKCIIDLIEKNPNVEKLCTLCNRILKLNEIKSILPKDKYSDYKKLLIESNLNNENIIRCLDKNCDGFKLFEDESKSENEFRCEKCNLRNCLLCKTIHDGISCKQYNEMISNGLTDDVQETINMLCDMVRMGIAMNCPECETFIEKDEGCDWLKCPECQLEICWVTRGPRWGKNGNGDLSGGCRCGVGGEKCHPDCKYCH